MIHLDDDTKKINLHAFGVTKDMTMMEIKPQFERADVIVYEGWWTRPNKAQTGAFDWDPMNAPVAIGAIQTMCAILEKTAKPPQQPASKVPGYSYMGMKYHKGKKGMHAHDALAHACFFAVTKLGANPVGAGN
jgi:hypothetical protein